MTKIVSIYYISGNVFQEIEYNNLNDLYNKLQNLLIINHDGDIYIYFIINK